MVWHDIGSVVRVAGHCIPPPFGVSVQAISRVWRKELGKEQAHLQAGGDQIDTLFRISYLLAIFCHHASNVSSRNLQSQWSLSWTAMYCTLQRGYWSSKDPVQKHPVLINLSGHSYV